MSEVVIEPVTEVVDGESPHWSVEEQCLYYVDITGSTIRRYHPATDAHSKLTIVGGPVVPIVPHRDVPNTFVVCMAHIVGALTWPDPTQDYEIQADQIVTLATAEEDMLDHRFNDGKCDANGRLWADTLSQDGNPKESALYRVDQDASITPVVQQVTMGNGVAFNQEGTILYYIDTRDRVVYGFDFDLATGTVSNQRAAMDFNTDPNLDSGNPDGLTVDVDGNLWVASFNSSSIYQIDPTAGKVLRTITGFPPKTTSAVWGGPDLDQLYVTVFEGAVYRVTGLGTKGFPAATCTVAVPTPKKKQ